MNAEEDLKFLKPGERIDDLSRSGFRIIQNPNYFRFATDAVILSEFAKVGSKDKILDMGTGSGIIPLLVFARRRPAHITGIELSAQMADMAERSVALNGLESHIEILNRDIREAGNDFGHDVFDVVTCNPPYFKVTNGMQNEKESVAMARHEIFCTLEDVIKNAFKVLKTKGRLYMIHRPGRLGEIFSLMREYKLSPSKLRSIHSYASSLAELVLIEAKKCVKCELEILQGLVIYNEDRTYTDEMIRIYDN